MMSGGDFVDAEVLSFLPVQDKYRTTPFPLESMAALQAAFNAVWRQAAQEAGLSKADDLQKICQIAANAVIAFAEAGLQPEHIRRYALSRVRFMIASRGGTSVEQRSKKD